MDKQYINKIFSYRVKLRQNGLVYWKEYSFYVYFIHLKTSYQL